MRQTSGPLVAHALDAQPKPFGEGNYAVYGAMRRFQWHGTTSLSIKTIRRGSALFKADRGIHKVQRGNFLVMNAGREYTVIVDEPEPIFGFSVFFAPGFVEKVSRESQGPDAKPIRESEYPFYERIYKDEKTLQKLYAFQDGFLQHQDDTLWLEQQTQDLALSLVALQTKVKAEVEAFAELRPAARDEVYRRLYKARDYAQACLDQKVSLTDLADVACFSPSYFLRSFRALYGKTPHQFLLELRLERARHLLRTTEKTVTEICGAVGFESLGSFSWTFSRRVGVSPEMYRRQCR